MIFAYISLLTFQEPPPPTEEEQEQGNALRASFKKVAGEDMEIDAFELQNVLNAVFTKGVYVVCYKSCFVGVTFLFHAYQHHKLLLSNTDEAIHLYEN